MDITGLWTIRDYLRRRYATISEYVAGIPIYKLFTGSERMEGSSRFLMWRDQEHAPTTGGEGIRKKYKIVYSVK